MGYNQYTVPDTAAIEVTFVAFSMAAPKHTSKASHAILLISLKNSTVYSKPPTIPFGIVACTFSDNLSRNSCMYYEETMKQTNADFLATDNDHFWHEGDILLEKFSSRLFLVYSQMHIAIQAT